VALGLSVFFLARILGILYFIRNVDDESIYKRSKKQLLYNTIPFLVFFLAFLIRLLLKDGFTYDPATYEVSMERYKYLHNLIGMPFVSVFLLAGIVLVLFGIYRGLWTDNMKGFYFGGIGTLLAVFALFLIAGLNQTCYYPSVFDLQSSLHIENSSSSHYTLSVMSYVSLLVPFILAYIVYAWSSINNKRINADEMKNETHIY